MIHPDPHRSLQPIAPNRPGTQNQARNIQLRGTLDEKGLPTKESFYMSIENISAEEFATSFFHYLEALGPDFASSSHLSPKAGTMFPSRKRVG